MFWFLRRGGYLLRAIEEMGMQEKNLIATRHLRGVSSFCRSFYISSVFVLFSFASSFYLPLFYLIFFIS